jgi:hypothetical protein
MSISHLRSIFILLLLIVFITPKVHTQSSSSEKKTSYKGGDSSALEAVLRIAAADKVSLGLTMGIQPTLCEQQGKYDFTGLSTYQALELSVAKTQYKLTLLNGVYNISANDLSTTEQQLQNYKFDSFSSDPTTMKELGGHLTGFIYDAVEGADSFFGDSLGNPNDELVSIPVYRNLTAPQIANEIVKLGSRGIWIMQATRNDAKPVPGSTIVSIYNYHDIQGHTPNVGCLQVATK